MSNEQSAVELWEDYCAKARQDPPPWLTAVNTRRCKVKTSDWQGSHINHVTLGDVLEYYLRQTSSMSGLRTLGNVNGDWREMDGLASECLSYFKAVNLLGLQRAGKKAGLSIK